MNTFNENHVTISQVAASAHVSMTTVSRYLNGKFEYMSAETKQRIADVIKEMNYHPSNIARSLKSRSSKSIGCVIADIGSPFSSILLKGINKVSDAGGYQVLFSDSENGPLKERNSIQKLLNSRVDGLIVNTTGQNDSLLVDLRERGVPIVLADRCISQKDKLDTVTAENYHITYECIRHLFHNGYQKVAFFTPGNGKISPRLERYQAYLDAMRDLYHLNGIRYTFQSDRDTAESYAVLLNRFIVQNPGERIAAFCVNGVTLIRLLQAMRLERCSIGRNFGICGFDNWEWASLIPPGITTIQKDSYAIGMRAAEILLKRISGGEQTEPLHIELESKLCIRGSTDPQLAAKF